MQKSISGSFRIKGGGAYDLTHVMTEGEDNRNRQIIPR